MDLRQQIIEDQIEATALNLGINKDQAFLQFAHTIITTQSMHAFDPADLVDGGQDKQIDSITIEPNGEEATIYILQAKHTKSFSSNSLVQMHNGLNWIFNKPKGDIAGLTNIQLKDKILEYRSLLRELGPSNIHVVVGFITNGITKDISGEFRQEEKTIRDNYDNETFASFDLLIWGATELVDQMNALEKRDRKIDQDIRIKYDANNPSLIRYHAQGLRGIVCTTSAHEIARIVNADHRGSIFDSNIRRFLGARGPVNSAILAACTKDDISNEFWFLNNGITIVCDSFDATTDPDNPFIKIKNMQIVNGCQTATTLALAERKGQLSMDVQVLLRIYQAPSQELVDKIVRATNNQNKITSRDLRANDPIQINMERAFATYNYLYERKPRQYDNQTNADAQHIAANELVAQSYLAIVMKNPSEARGRKYKVWEEELYRQIFSGEAIEPYIISWQIHKHTSAWIKRSGYRNDSDDIRRKLASSGTFYIARIASFLWRRGDEYKTERTQLQEQIRILESDPHAIDTHINDAFSQLETIIRGDQHYKSDLDKALKASTLDKDIDRTLYNQHKKPVATKYKLASKA